jgi:hypothetical protein
VLTLVVVETMILFIGVIARYIVQPLVWSDELASPFSCGSACRRRACDQARRDCA